MATNIWDSESEICNGGHLEKTNYSQAISAIAKDAKSAQKGYKVHKKIEEWFGFKDELKWTHIMQAIILHICALYTLYAVNIFENITTFTWTIFLLVIQVIGVTGGVHRLWSHRAYKAKLPLRILILIFYLISGQLRVFDWVRNHRVHHKYPDTDADPHNSNRGFFFSHMGWLMMKKKPEVIREGREIDMSDILADPIIVFVDKYFMILKPIFCLVLPTMVPVYGWNETWIRSIYIQIFRYVLGNHFLFIVGSLSHMWGSKPYDAGIKATNNKLVAFLAMGEGWHNYHHVFPWDYKGAEFGDYKLNVTTMFIDFFAKIGWAYDLKQPSRQLVMSVIAKKGDGSHHMWDSVPHPDNKIEK
ncbi:acyl-CoA Delta(11) desaturase-like [Odontomachus brunneus]|uniref:acyl-CoA Delta(11) desaturase-like n=1 Tax=Odontomachus brunneus TaxID=486640 RepID=UPI0013F2045D|nr:acyl-CoA Delta(11) desaturase-like [Odontomachus brunneus]